MIAISTILFDGPFSSKEHLLNQGGVYAVLVKNFLNRFVVVDIKEADDVKNNIEASRSDKINKSVNKELFYAVYYDEANKRKFLEKQLKTVYIKHKA